MARHCSRCKCELEAGYKQSYCRPCKQARKKEARINARIEKGLPMWGDAKTRKICLICSKEKEDINQSYCNGCRSVLAKHKRREQGIPPKPIDTGLCPCGAPRAPRQKRFCANCKAADSREYRKKNPLTEEQKQKEKERHKAYYTANKERIKKRFDEDAKFRAKKLARAMVNRYIAANLLAVEACEVCGSREKVEAHHDDYFKPLEIRWLCKKHHDEHHVNERILNSEDYLT